MMNIEYAADIEECVVCERLYFPGDEVVRTDEGQAHADHFPITKVDVTDSVALFR